MLDIFHLQLALGKQAELVQLIELGELIYTYGGREPLTKKYEF